MSGKKHNKMKPRFIGLGVLLLLGLGVIIYCREHIVVNWLQGENIANYVIALLVATVFLVIGAVVSIKSLATSIHHCEEDCDWMGECSDNVKDKDDD
ncbi:MAG: hypothetical protein NTY33_04615 [Candidatus Moranbacteria bacterium]|nr:hypothetical protein [Candidatus Moranbacteria bacterium]